MANDYFEFKQFTIKQDKCAMKVGTDAVLLGAWAEYDTDKKCRILDIGTGTGILSIMAAQKKPDAYITAIEIDKEASEQASYNSKQTPWYDRINIIKGDISLFESNEQFDFIISNPPFFENALKSPDKQRTNARHTESLTFNQLAENIKRLLKTDGKCYIILPYKAESSFCNAAINSYLYPSHKVNIVTKQGQKPKRAIIVLKHKVTTYTEECITIRDNEGNYTEQFRNITKDFYKKL